MNSESIIISFIFIIHLFLVSWAVLAFMNFSYAIYNIFFFVSLLWGVHDTKASAPLFVALMINVMSIVFDAALIGVLWEITYRTGFRFVFSIIASFGNMFLRLITSYVLYRILSQRRENDTNHEDIGSVTRDLLKMLNVSRSPPPAPPQRGPGP